MNEELAVAIAEQAMKRFNLWSVMLVQKQYDTSWEKTIDIIKERLIRAVNKRIAADDWLEFTEVENPEKYSEENLDMFLQMGRKGYEIGYMDAVSDILEVLMGEE